MFNSILRSRAAAASLVGRAISIFLTRNEGGGGGAFAPYSKLDSVSESTKDSVNVVCWYSLIGRVSEDANLHLVQYFSSSSSFLLFDLL